MDKINKFLIVYIKLSHFAMLIPISKLLNIMQRKTDKKYS